MTNEAQLALYRQAEEHTRDREKLQRYPVIHAEHVAKHYAAVGAEQENALSSRVLQLEMALQLQEHTNSHIRAQKEYERVAMVARVWCSNPTPMHTSLESEDYLDGMSNAGRMKSQVGYVASLVNIFVSPFQSDSGIQLNPLPPQTPVTILRSV